MQAARDQWKSKQPELDVKSLVFLDETGASTKMVRQYGRSPKGSRCVSSAPYGHWKTTTFIAGLRHDCVSAPMVLDGAMDGEAYLSYIKKILCPTLRPGDIVIADNLPCHKVSGVQAAIESVGAEYRYLPPYSPDLNPIEKMFSKLKSLLRKAAKRTVEELWEEIKNILKTFTAEECANYFSATGYKVANN